MIRGKRVTIRDVARTASVSPTAVSRHLNRQITLPERTAARIDDAAAQLGYQPNQLARNLSRGRSGIIGLVTPDIANPFFAQLASAAAEEAAAAGFHVLLCSTQNDPERELAYLEMLGSRQLDGLVVLTSCAVTESLGLRHERIVLIDEDAAVKGVPKVFVENQRGGFLATEHLLARGHRRVAHIGGPEGTFSARERFAGYSAALIARQLPLEPSLTYFGPYTETFGQEAAAQLLAQAEPPSAIFVASDYVALGVLKVFKARGVHVPEDISLVGFDDISLASLLNPALTTVQQPIERLGRRGVRLLIGSLLGTGAEPAHTERLPVSLIERESVKTLSSG